MPQILGLQVELDKISMRFALQDTALLNCTPLRYTIPCYIMLYGSLTFCRFPSVDLLNVLCSLNEILSEMHLRTAFCYKIVASKKHGKTCETMNKEAPKKVRVDIQWKGLAACRAATERRKPLENTNRCCWRISEKFTKRNE